MRLFLTLTIAVALVLLTGLAYAAGPAGADKDQQIAQLQERVAQLEKRVSELEARLKPLLEKTSTDQVRQMWQQKARQRMAQDGQRRKPQELREAEQLYQVANAKGKWGTPEARESLKQMIQKYPDVNRTGCAVMYLAQMSEGEERVEYLNQAIEKFGDCFYGDGTQVGPLAMLYLAKHYQDQGQAEKASELFDRIRREAPQAIGHNGNLLVEQLPKP